MIETAKQLHARATAMLNWPLERTTVSVGQAGSISIVIEPAGWNKATAIDLIKAATDLEQLVFSGAFRPKPESEDAPAKPKPSKRSRKVPSS
ncbi:hypothetical protein [Singulisphaera sp. PoT]|uniref:hypothetical protein n=1 Tax=Singulisphaera sp. PoT TaxID=3411797 RepID=UPI003BF6045F